MFHNIQTADDIPAYEAYWCREIRESSKRTKSKGKGTFIVKAYRDGFNVGALPYSLVTAVDMGSFGCMSFQMLSGQELIPTDINQIVVLGHMHKAATWTDDKLSQRIETFIVDEDAQDLVKRLLWHARHQSRGNTLRRICTKSEDNRKQVRIAVKNRGVAQPIAGTDDFGYDCVNFATWT
ncbi:hypothetical protein As57867_005899, partial [Aphanomyces stellatus]